jgi:hypothetical protein
MPSAQLPQCTRQIRQVCNVQIKHYVETPDSDEPILLLGPPLGKVLCSIDLTQPRLSQQQLTFTDFFFRDNSCLVVFAGPLLVSESLVKLLVVLASPGLVRWCPAVSDATPSRQAGDSTLDPVPVLGAG